MACRCNTKTLRLFIRSVVQIDLRPTSHLGSQIPLSASRRRFSTFWPLGLRNSRSTKQSIAAPYVEEYISSSSLGSAGFTTPNNGSSPSTNASVTHRGITTNGDNEGGGGAMLDINPDTIEALSSDARRESARQSASPLKRAPTFRRNAPLAISRSGTEGGNTLSQRRADESKPRFQMERDDEPPYAPTKREPWQAQKAALKHKFQDGWNPRKRLSPDALAGIRAIHAQFPEQYTTSVLAEKFQVSPESIRRILKSNWTPKEDEELDRQRRWFKRGQNVWVRYAELGLKPPKKWRALGINEKRSSEQGFGRDTDRT